MANYRGHIGGGIIVGVIYLTVLSLFLAVDILPLHEGLVAGFAFPVVLLGLAVLFALFPDVDINSHSQDLFYSVFFIIDVWLIWSRNFEEAAYLGLLAMLPVISKHRGWTHSKISMFIVPLPLLVLPALQSETDPLAGLAFYGAAVAGYFSHLALDGLIPGLRLLRKVGRG